jgi:ribosomal protein L16 Arg81 hydroxylase
VSSELHRMRPLHGNTHDLPSLLHPIPVSEFFDNHWECKPLVIHRNDAEYYAGLLTSRDLEDIISTSDMRYPALRLSKNGTFYPPQSYTTDVTVGRLTFSGVPDVNRISLEYGRGATISLQAFHRNWSPLSALCIRLEEALDYAAHANVYITPGETSGFPPHYDTHEVLVLQIAGRKKWLIDEPPLKLPHTSQSFESTGLTPGPRMMETELVAGDTLYLPRGYVHSTTTSESHSAHITIGINVLTWADVLREFLPSCLGSDEYRRALPPGFASRPELRPALKRRLTEMLPDVPMAHDVLIDRAIAAVQAGRRRIPARFRADVTTINADSLLQTPARQRYGIAQSKEDLVLHFDGRNFAFPRVMGGVLETMCAQGTFRVTELAGSPNAEASLNFARALQSIGFLQVRSHS